MNLRALSFLATLGCAVAACSSTDTTTSTTTTGSGGAGGAGSGGASSATSMSSTTTSGDATSSGSSSSTGVVEPTELIHYLGRFDFSDPMAPASSWPGSAIAARFSGTGLDIDLHDDGQNFFAVSIDGATPTLLTTSSDNDKYSLATGLADAEHEVVVTRRTESFQGVVHFHALNPLGGGKIVPSPAPFKRHIELIGDSITCGYGNEGMGPGCSFSADTENEWLAYGSIAARGLSAEPHVIAYSGKGAYRDYGGATDNQMPVLYELTFAEDPAVKWDFTAWKADVVVVNLGTNDFAKGDPGQAYIDAYTALVKQIRGHYADAYIVCAVGSMLGGGDLAKDLTYVKGVVAAANTAGDKKVSFVDLGQQDGNADGLGCDYHPSLKTHQKMADKLTAAIKAVAGW